jgi:hypothetical protein
VNHFETGPVILAFPISGKHGTGTVCLPAQENESKGPKI